MHIHINHYFIIVSLSQQSQRRVTNLALLSAWERKISQMHNRIQCAHPNHEPMKAFECSSCTYQQYTMQRKTAECQRRKTSQEERRKLQPEEKQLELCWLSGTLIRITMKLLKKEISSYIFGATYIQVEEECNKVYDKVHAWSFPYFLSNI